MSEFQGFDVPSVLRTAISSRCVQDGSGENLPVPLLMLERLDRLQKTAFKTLTSFSSAHQQSENETTQVQGWTMVKSFEKPDSFFDFASDPMASDCIVARKVFMNDQNGKAFTGFDYFWISPQNDTKFGLPFVYRLITEGGIPKRASLLPINYIKTEQDAKIYQQQLFSTSYEALPDLRFVLQIWKHGETKKQKGKKQKYYLSPKLKLSPVPQRI